MQLYLNYKNKVIDRETDYHFKFFEAPTDLNSKYNKGFINGLKKIMNGDNAKIFDLNKTKINTVLDNYDKKFHKLVYIAGSFLKTLYRKSKSIIHDIDVFIQSRDDMNDIKDYLINKYQYKVLKETKDLITLKLPRNKPIQLIYREEEPEGIVGMFDIGSLCIYYLLNDKKIYMNQRAVNEICSNSVIPYYNILHKRYYKHIYKDKLSVYLPKVRAETGLRDLEKTYNILAKTIFMANQSVLMHECSKCHQYYQKNKNIINKLIPSIQLCDKCASIEVTKRSICVVGKIPILTSVKSTEVYHIDPNLLHEHKREFALSELYEMISDENKIKKALYFDIDLSVDKDDINLYSILTEYIAKFIKIGNKLTKMERFNYYYSLRNDKISIHIIGDRYIYSVAEIKKMAELFAKDINGIDMSVYRANSLYRLPYTYKRNIKSNIQYCDTLLTQFSLIDHVYPDQCIYTVNLAEYKKQVTESTAKLEDDKKL